MRPPRFTVYYTEYGFLEEDGTGRPKVCSTQLERSTTGRPFCYRTCVYRVRKVSKYGAWIAYYCDHDLPEELVDLDVIYVEQGTGGANGHAASPARHTFGHTPRRPL